MTDGSFTSWKVETRTKASTTFAIVASLCHPARLCRALRSSRAACIQDLFFILTMLVLAQNWNLLAGYAGLVSVGQQAFVGFGAYAMFALVILVGLDPLVAILLAGIASALLAIPTAFFLFRLQGAYFAIGTWVIAEVVRLALAQWKMLGGGTGTSLPREATRDMPALKLVGDLFGVKSSRRRRHPDLLAGAAARHRHHRPRLPPAALASRGWGWPPYATTRKRRARSASTRGA